jgi:hypothetical protein
MTGQLTEEVALIAGAALGDGARTRFISSSAAGSREGQLKTT